MLKKNLFKKPQNELENYGKQEKSTDTNLVDEIMTVCPNCKTQLTLNQLGDYFYVCKKCSYHLRVNARTRIAKLLDENSFQEFDSELKSENLLHFPEYDKKLKNARLESSENEGVVTGIGMIYGLQCAIFVMDPFFMMGSMGVVVGEKITRLFEYATEHDLPIIGFTVSGGARMQEGIYSLMQMAKTSGAVKRHSDLGNLYIAILTDPTSGGVTASFAMEADIIVSEPNALICFAGPRVIEQTIRHKLPNGFQRAEFLLQHGFIDMIVDRRQQRMYLKQILALHKQEK